MATLLENLASLERLTPKQKEVLVFISEGLTSKEIARKLDISESAVNQRIESIRQRLGGLSRSRIARIYREQNTLRVTIPTSNSLAGKLNQLQHDGDDAQLWSAEGVIDLADPDSGQTDGRLQPSTFPSAWDGPGFVWLRLGTIIASAVGLVALVVLVLDAAEKAERILG